MGFRRKRSGVAEGIAAPGIIYRIEGDTLVIEGSGRLPDFSMRHRAPWHFARESLLSLSLSEGITAIGRYAFADCSFYIIRLPASLTYIAPYAFTGCDALHEVSFLSEGELVIDEYAFSACTALSSVFFPPRLSTVGRGAFDGCPFLRQVNYPGTAEAFSALPKGENWWGGGTEPSVAAGVRPAVRREVDPAFSYRLTEDGDLFFSGAMPDYADETCTPWYTERERILRVVAGPDSRVGAHAFAGLPELRVAELSGVLRIGEAAFSGCAALCGIQLSPAAELIGRNAFAGCPRLFLLDFDGSEEAAQALFSAYSDAGFLPDRLIIRSLPASSPDIVLTSSPEEPYRYTLSADGVLTILSGRIEQMTSSPLRGICRQVRHIVVRPEVLRIGGGVFSSMPELLSLTVVGDTEIGDSAFSSCPKLTDIHLFCAVRRIGPYAFAGESSLTVMFCGLSLISLPHGVFSECHRLQTLLLPAFATISDGQICDGCPQLQDVKFLGTRESARNLPASFPGRVPVRCLWSDEWIFSSHDLAGEEAFRERLGRFSALADTAEEHLEKSREELREATRCFFELIRQARTDLPPETDAGRSAGGRHSARRHRDKREKELRRSIRRITAAYTEAGRIYRRVLRFGEEYINCAEAAVRQMKTLFPYGTEALREAEAHTAVARRLATAEPIPGAYTVFSEHGDNILYLLENRRFEEAEKILAELNPLLPLAEAPAEETETPEEKSMKRPPRILISTATSDPKDPVNAQYIHAVTGAGGEAFLYTGGEQEQDFDGLILAGGADISPMLYGEKRLPDTEPDERRDEREVTLFKAFYLYGKPIFGISRGHQMIHACLGGRLMQSLPEPYRAYHREAGQKPATHAIQYTAPSILSSIYGPTGRMTVLSIHHQAVELPGKHMKTVATAEDGLIEASEHEYLPVYSTQFHPERMIDPLSVHTDDGRPLFTFFVRKCAVLRDAPLVSEEARRYAKKKKL